MDIALQLLGLVVFTVGIVGLAAIVTAVVVKLLPSKEDKAARAAAKAPSP